MAAAYASAFRLVQSSFEFRNHNNNFPTSKSFNIRFPRRKNSLCVSASVSISNTDVRTGPNDLVASLLSKVLYYVFFFFLFIILFTSLNIQIMFIWFCKNFIHTDDYSSLFNYM